MISRSSSFSFKGRDVPLKEIAATLGVAYILEGSVQRAGKTLRISAQLIDARSDQNVWSKSWDRPFDDVFAIQDEIAGTVVGQLKLKLLGKAEAIDPEAYELFLQARELGRQNSHEGYERGILLLQQVLSKVQGYAPAWTQLGEIYTHDVQSTAQRLLADALRPSEADILTPELAISSSVEHRRRDHRASAKSAISPRSAAASASAFHAKLSATIAPIDAPTTSADQCATLASAERTSTLPRASPARTNAPVM